MNRIALVFTFLLVAFCHLSCENEQNTEFQSIGFEEEKAAILTTLHNETKAAFQRGYAEWTKYWIHRSNASKTYINFHDSTFSETIGWVAISGFVKIFIDENPEPETVPALSSDVKIRLYGNGAWVSYEQVDSARGLKRETRLMEKVDGKWKISGMHTTIYGHSQEAY